MKLVGRTTNDRLSLSLLLSVSIDLAHDVPCTEHTIISATEPRGVECRFIRQTVEVRSQTPFSLASDLELLIILTFAPFSVACMKICYSSQNDIPPRSRVSKIRCTFCCEKENSHLDLSFNSILSNFAVETNGFLVRMTRVQGRIHFDEEFDAVTCNCD